MYEGGHFLSDDMETPDGELPGDMGCFPVGESCYKRFLKMAEQKMNYYMLLGRLQSDCKYYIDTGIKTQLWAGNEIDQIKEMVSIYNKLPKEPKQISLKDIDYFSKKMTGKTLAENGLFKPMDIIRRKVRNIVNAVKEILEHTKK